MTALTGETGAGKTLVVEALQLVLGGRASPGMVRAGAVEALVEARFVVPAPGSGGADPVEVILARSVPAEGRTRAWVDGRMASVGALAEAAADLVEVHGQHEHRALVTASAQRDVLDAFAGTDLSRVRALRSQLRALDDGLAALGGDAQQRARETDVLRYQVAEIAAARLEDPGEEAALLAEEDRLADAGASRAAALDAAESIDPSAGEGGALDLLARAAGALTGRAAFDPYRVRVRGGRCRALRRGPLPARRGRGLGGRPRPAGRGPGSTAPAGGPATEVRRGPGRRHRLRRAGRGATRRARGRRGRGGAAPGRTGRAPRRAGPGRGGRAPRARAKAAGAFGAQVGERLGALAMAGARVEVRLAPKGTGEPVELLLGANVGEPVQPLARAASGGELARAMLAIRLVDLGGPQTMVFDEVDAGVGGAAALALGEALHEVACQRQVLVVTHLAQVASQADAQVMVEKASTGGRTVTTATAVQGEARVTELSRMLSGHPGSDAARAHARELLGATHGG